MIGFNVRELKSFISVNFLENELVDVSWGNEDWDSCFDQWVGVRWVFGDGPAWRESVEDSVLGFCFELDVVFKCFKSVFACDLVSVKVNDVFLEVWIQAAFFNKDGKVFVPSAVLFGIFLGLVFQELEDSFGQEWFEFGHQGRILIIFSWDVQGNVLTVNNTSEESQEIGDKDFLAVFLD